MAKITNDAGETSENVPSPLSDAGSHDNYYGRELRIRISSSSVNVYHTTKESSVRFHPKQGRMSRGLRQLERQTAAVQQESAIVFW
ncbi:unnamed protein product [Protopolystoma xenopodis]|uniref:Uncharacterized protein n=1 Tax=Protopolystoma xenopodis TaxID=117903 RepID=A0A448WGA3_9PLAT|nr:unnamed protein product [Protopolystoma xenopodis]